MSFENSYEIQAGIFESPWVMCHLLITASHEAKFKYEDRSWQGDLVKSPQAVGDGIMTLRKQFAQL